MGGQSGGRWLPQKISYHEMMLRMTPAEKHDVGHRAPSARHRGVRSISGGTSTLEAVEDTSELSLPGLQ